MILIFDFLFISGIVLTCIIEFLIFKSNIKELPHQLLFLIFLLILFVSLNAYAELHNLSLLYTISYVFMDPIGFALGPLVLLYIKSIYTDNSQLLRKNLIHFIPLFIYLPFVLLPSLISINNGKPIKWAVWILDNIPFLDYIQSFYLIAYSLISLHLLKGYQDRLKINYSNLAKKDLQWIRILLIGIISLIVLNIITSSFENYLGNISWDISHLTTAAMVLLVLILGYHGISQAKILVPSFLQEPLKDPTPVIEEKNISDNIGEERIPEEMIRIIDRLKSILENQKPFKNPDLDLTSLAKTLQLSDKKLSGLLNQYMNTNFYTLINKYRVEDLKQKIQNGEAKNLTLLALAFESGFNSKSSFNRIFKKETGLSPSQFRKLHN